MDSVRLLSWSEWSKVFQCSKALHLFPGLLSISAMIFNIPPLLCPSKYQLICNFHSNYLFQTNNKPLALPLHPLWGLKCICQYFQIFTLKKFPKKLYTLKQMTMVMLTAVICLLHNFCSYMCSMCE